MQPVTLAASRTEDRDCATDGASVSVRLSYVGSIEKANA